MICKATVPKWHFFHTVPFPLNRKTFEKVSVIFFMIEFLPIQVWRGIRYPSGHAVELPEWIQFQRFKEGSMEVKAIGLFASSKFLGIDHLKSDLRFTLQDCSSWHQIFLKLLLSFPLIGLCKLAISEWNRWKTTRLNQHRRRLLRRHPCSHFLHRHLHYS